VSDKVDAEFEVVISGQLARRGWLISLAGRIDQLVRVDGQTVLREIKTVTRPLPTDEAELRSDYPEYFVQVATYAALRGGGERCELIFVEVDSGLAQTIVLTPADEALVNVQLDRVAEFLDLRLRARERLRALHFRPAFAVPRDGQVQAPPSCATTSARASPPSCSRRRRDSARRASS
jgi:DNA excision repair protein ERCC-2